MNRISITGFSGDLVSVTEDVGDGVWRVSDENGDEFTFTYAEVRELAQLLDAVVDELDNRENA